MNTLLTSLAASRESLTAQIAAAYDADDMELQATLVRARCVIERKMDKIQGM